MSKLIDKLKKLSQAAPTPMGFRTSRPSETQAPLLIIGRMALKTTASTAKINHRADGVLVYTDKASITAVNVQKITKALGDVPWGVYLEEIGGSMVSLIKAGCDFVVFSPTARITDLPQDEKVGKIVQVESSMDDGLLRAINNLPADAVVITDTLEKNDTLVWHQLMIYQHLTNFIAKPIIVPVSASITESELKALQDAGIDGVMAETDAVAGENLKELREIISKLPPRSIKKRERGGVLLPRAVGETRQAPPPDEEEEEE